MYFRVQQAHDWKHNRLTTMKTIWPRRNAICNILASIFIAMCLCLWMHLIWRDDDVVKREEAIERLKFRNKVESEQASKSNATDYSREQGKGDALSSNKETTYLLPLLDYIHNGPGWWMLEYRIAVSFALHFNRTLVLVPLKTHQRDTVKAQFVAFNTTFDEEVISQILPTVSLEEYVKVCGNVLTRDNIIIDPFHKEIKLDRPSYIQIYNEYRAYYKEGLNLVLPDETSIPNSELQYTESLHSFKSQRCLAVLRPHEVKIEFPEAEDFKRTAAIHLARAPFVRNIVDDIQSHLCDRKPFIAIHWRNTTGERCTPRLESGTVADECTDLRRKRMGFMKDLSPRIADAIVNYTKNVSVQCVYIAHPPFQQQIMSDLKSILPENPKLRIYSMDDVITLPAMKPYTTDTYTISLVEQEICVRAEQFLPWFIYGSWSTVITKERISKGLPNCPLLSLRGIPWVAADYA